MDESTPEERVNVSGHIKWFDPARGFGFLADDAGGNDVLLHANVLRNFGQSSVADGSRVELVAVITQRGRQAVEVLRIDPPAAEGGHPPIADLEMLDGTELDRLPLLPARVKWFDKIKGFGFANIFGRRGDVFLHVEVLRHSGFADLAAGEAVGLRMIDGPRGMMAAQIVAWERAAQPEARAAARLAELSGREPAASMPARPVRTKPAAAEPGALSRLCALTGATGGASGAAVVETVAVTPRLGARRP